MASQQELEGGMNNNSLKQSNLVPLFLPLAQRKQRLGEEQLKVEGKDKLKEEGQYENHATQGLADMHAGHDKKQTEEAEQEMADEFWIRESPDRDVIPGVLNDSKKHQLARLKKASLKGKKKDLGNEKLTTNGTGELDTGLPRPSEKGASFDEKARTFLISSAASVQQRDMQQTGLLVDSAKLDETAPQALKKVPDIFLTTNERKQRQQKAKEEEKRVQEEKAVAAEQAKLEKARLKEERRKEAEKRKLEAKEEKARAAEERKLRAKAERESAKKAAESGREGTPEKRKRGRPPKSKLQEKENGRESTQTSENEEGAQQGPSLLEKMRKRQEDFKESIRESQEAHAKLHAGKTTHPFFMRKQGPPANNGAAADVEPLQAKEAKPFLEPLCPMHVTQAGEEEAQLVHWSERQLSATEASTSECSLELPSLHSLLDLSSPDTSNGRPVHSASPPVELQESALKALSGFMKLRSQASEKTNSKVDSPDALEQRFERYKTRAAVPKCDDDPLLDPSSDTGGERATKALWLIKYQPLSSEEVCGNQSSVLFIRDWLCEWTEKIAREQQKKLLKSAKPKPKPDTWQASEESSEWLVSGGVSDSELGDEEGGPPHALLLSGPTGVGKTATVYALAQELGFQVLESNPSEKRSRALVLQRFGEATESKGLLKWSLKGRNAPLEEKPGAVRGAVARFFGQHKTSPIGIGPPAERRGRLPQKRSTRKRRPKSPLSESEISAFRESSSLDDSVVSKKRARSKWRRAKCEAVDLEQRGEDQGVEQTAVRLGQGKRSGKRRKKVGFDVSPITKGEPLFNAPAKGEHSEQMPRESDGRKNDAENAKFVGYVALGSGQELALGEARGGSIEIGLEHPSAVEGPAENEILDFEPVYRRQKGKSRKGRNQTAQLSEEAGQGKGEKEKEGEDCLGTTEKQSSDAGKGLDEGNSEMEPQVLAESMEAKSPEASAKSDSGDSLAKARGSRGTKRRGERKSPDGDCDTLPTRKRRSFGRPAVLLKVRTRPCSPEDKEGSNSGNPKGPVSTSAEAPVDVRDRREGAETGDLTGNRVSRAGTETKRLKTKVATRSNAKQSSKALLLFEEVETQFEEDKGFMSAIATLATTTKRPMILTCNESSEVVSACDFRKLSVEFGAPPTAELTVHACLVAASEGCPVNPWVVERLVELSKGNIRRGLLQMQLWSQPTPTDLAPSTDVLRPLLAVQHASAVVQTQDERQEAESGLPDAQDTLFLPNKTSKLQSAADAPAGSRTDRQDPSAEITTERHPCQAEEDPDSTTVERSRRSRGDGRISSLWLPSAVRELQLAAAHRSLPALADVALPCQLAAAVATHQNCKILRQERLAQISVEKRAARMYEDLEEEAVCAARIRKALQEAKAAARAAGKAEQAEKRRLAREAKRAAKRAAAGNGDEAKLMPPEDLELEDVPIGSPVRRRLRGRRVALSEDDVSEGPADLIVSTSHQPVQAGGAGEEEIEVELEQEGQMQNAEALQGDQACAICRRTDAEESMLLCDGEGCQGAVHTFCSQPLIDSIPEGEWFCRKCLDSERADQSEGVQERPRVGRSEGGGQAEATEVKGELKQETGARRPDASGPEGEGFQRESFDASVIAGDFKVQQAPNGLAPLQSGKEVGRSLQRSELRDCGLLEGARDLGTGNGGPAQEVVELQEETASQTEDSLPEEVSDLRVEELRELVSRDSRQAVPTAAALWKLTDDILASELLSEGVDAAGKAGPSLEQDVPKQAAACLAYAGLREGLKSLSTAKHPSTGASQSEGTDARNVQNREPSNGKTTTCNALDRVTSHTWRPRGGGASDSVQKAQEIATMRMGELEGADQLLAAAGDEDALCHFLVAGEEQPDLRWLQLRMDPTAEQKELERIVTAQSLRELSFEATSSRSCGWLRTGLASLEYAGFLGRMSDLIEQRENLEDGWLRSERASQAYLPAWDVPDKLLRTLRRHVKYGPPG